MADKGKVVMTSEVSVARLPRFCRKIIQVDTWCHTRGSPDVPSVMCARYSWALNCLVQSNKYGIIWKHVHG